MWQTLPGACDEMVNELDFLCNYHFYYAIITSIMANGCFVLSVSGCFFSVFFLFFFLFSYPSEVPVMFDEAGTFWLRA